MKGTMPYLSFSLSTHLFIHFSERSCLAYCEIISLAHLSPWGAPHWFSPLFSWRSRWEHYSIIVLQVLSSCSSWLVHASGDDVSSSTEFDSALENSSPPAAIIIVADVPRCICERSARPIVLNLRKHRQILQHHLPADRAHAHSGVVPGAGPVKLCREGL